MKDLILVTERGYRGSQKISETMIFTADFLFCHQFSGATRLPYGFQLYLIDVNTGEAPLLITKKTMQDRFCRYEDTDLFRLFVTDEWRR